MRSCSSIANFASSSEVYADCGGGARVVVDFVVAYGVIINDVSEMKIFSQSD